MRNLLCFLLLLTIVIVYVCAADTKKHTNPVRRVPYQQGGNRRSTAYKPPPQGTHRGNHREKTPTRPKVTTVHGGGNIRGHDGSKVGGGHRTPVGTGHKPGNVHSNFGGNRAGYRQVQSRPHQRG